MKTREEVIEGLNGCASADALSGCGECPYYAKERCCQAMATDALALLNATPSAPPVDGRGGLLAAMLFSLPNASWPMWRYVNDAKERLAYADKLAAPGEVRNG